MTLKYALTAALAATSLVFAPVAHAHVKWFAPYIVEAKPQAILSTLGNAWFWAAADADPLPGTTGTAL